MRKKITLALLSLLLVPLAMMAQSVTVDPSTGKLIACLSYEGEQGFSDGWSSTWRHEQLPMDFIVKDEHDGQYLPAGNMCVYNNQLVTDGGTSIDIFYELYLPKGYRFKGYKLVMLNNINGRTIQGASHGSTTDTRYYKVMYETNSDYSYGNYKARGAYSDGGNNAERMYDYNSNNSNTREYVIERMSKTEDDMGNQLFFRMHHSRNGNYFYGATIKSFTVYFTAEGTFEAEAKPSSADVALSLVRSPFETNKYDIGKLQQEGNYFAYTYSNVNNIKAYTYIYQDDAHEGGIPMNVATKKKINPVTIGNNQYYAFENGTYYVEAPTQVYSQTGLSYPIGYRIVGAKFTPRWGQAVPARTQNRTLYYITYTSGGQIYYLNDQLHFTTTKFGWYYDSTTKNVYVGSGDDAQYLACEGSGGDRTLTYSITNGGYYNLEVSGNEIGWTSSGYYLRGTTDPSATVHMTNDAATNDHAKVSSGTESVTLASYNPGAFTLNVYDKTGSSIAGTASVSSTGSGAGNAIDLSEKNWGYNNDAIKFEITGLQEGHHALVDVSVFMQALNPYIDQMNIVCHDPSNTIELSQPFDAQNFRVSGGQIKFNIPSGFTGNLNFTFKDLYSQYGDNTYYSNNTSLQKDGYARYSFVTSPYFYDFNEVKGDGTNDGSTDLGLYDTRYIGTSPITAQNAQPGAKIAYDTKVYAETAGNIRFKFNNAENLSNTNPTPGTNYLEEYPFSVAKYIGSSNPDGGAMKGAFVTPTMNAGDTESSTYYVFTADETRYNIAPSYNWQHRYYAFYRMEIDLQTDTYVPNLGWTKVYDKTCYNKNGSAAYDAMWGLKLTTVKEGSTTPVDGFLTVKEISDAITATLTSAGSNHPTSADQILYVDAGDLHTIQNSTVTSGDQTTTMDIGTLQQSLSKNVMIYLPSTITSIYDNCAKKTSNWSTGDPYYATRDIVLTDNVPFFAPFDIYVDVDNVIKHERKITVPKNGKVTSASIIMPFDIQIDESGKHTNLDGQQFTLHQMASTNCLTTGDGADFVYFPVVSGVSAAPANKPYLVQVLNAPDDDQISFVLSQKGGTIKATTGYATDDTYKYTYPGETGRGTKDGVTYTFTNHGSYSGKLLAKMGNFFYYWKNQFVRSNDYSYNADIKIAPFRTYYSSTSTNGAKALQSFDVLFDEGSETDGITMNEFENIDANAPVYDLQGRKLANSLLESSLGKGVYVINGVKIIIK
jgi:hypothetical protein